MHWHFIIFSIFNFFKTILGTKWCGPGQTAKNDNELGYFKEVDACCRAHDNCEHVLPFSLKHGLRNVNVITRLTCRCETEFENCLKRINSFASNFIGGVYFSVQQKCYVKSGNGSDSDESDSSESNESDKHWVSSIFNRFFFG